MAAGTERRRGEELPDSRRPSRVFHRPWRLAWAAGGSLDGSRDGSGEWLHPVREMTAPRRGQSRLRGRARRGRELGFWAPRGPRRRIGVATVADVHQPVVLDRRDGIGVRDERAGDELARSPPPRRSSNRPGGWGCPPDGSPAAGGPLAHGDARLHMLIALIGTINAAGIIEAVCQCPGRGVLVLDTWPVAWGRSGARDTSRLGPGHSPGGKSVEAARSACASKPVTRPTRRRWSQGLRSQDDAQRGWFLVDTGDDGGGYPGGVTRCEPVGRVEHRQEAVRGVPS